MLGGLMTGSALCREVALPLPRWQPLARPVRPQQLEGARPEECVLRQGALASAAASFLLTAAAASSASAATLASR